MFSVVVANKTNTRHYLRGIFYILKSEIKKKNRKRNNNKKKFLISRGILYNTAPAFISRKLFGLIAPNYAGSSL